MHPRNGLVSVGRLALSWCGCSAMFLSALPSVCRGYVPCCCPCVVAIVAMFAVLVLLHVHGSLGCWRPGHRARLGIRRWSLEAARHLDPARHLAQRRLTRGPSYRYWLALSVDPCRRGSRPGLRVCSLLSQQRVAVGEGAVSDERASSATRPAVRAVRRQRRDQPRAVSSTAGVETSRSSRPGAPWRR